MLRYMTPCQGLHLCGTITQITIPIRSGYTRQQKSSRRKTKTIPPGGKLRIWYPNPWAPLLRSLFEFYNMFCRRKAWTHLLLVNEHLCDIWGGMYTRTVRNKHADRSASVFSCDPRPNITWVHHTKTSGTLRWQYYGDESQNQGRCTRYF